MKTLPHDHLEAALRAHYPVLADIPADRWQSSFPTLPCLEVPARVDLFDEGQPCQGFPFVLSGEVRVTRTSSDGRALELYRVVPGEVCVVSAGCLFGTRPMSARGTTLSTCTLVVAPVGVIRDWCDTPAVRDFLFGLLADRLAELMELVEAIAFQRLDQRLARTLLGHGRTRHATHQQLADELGTAREMVSRLLKRFETDGLVGLGRERIEIVDAHRLRSLAGDQ